MSIKSLVQKTPPKESLTIRLPRDVREEAERLAEKYGVSLALLVEAGLKLLFKQEMEEAQNALLDRTLRSQKVAAMEQKQAEGYAKHPSKKDEFSEWEFE